MRNQQNAYLTQQMEERSAQQRWERFCQSGLVTDYLDYKSSCTDTEGAAADADASDRQGSGRP